VSFFLYSLFSSFICFFLCRYPCCSLYFPSLLFLSWYHLEQRDKNDPTKVTPMGSICYSIQIWPKDKAIVMPAGAARTEPNSNPFLPPPVGRLKFSWLVSLFFLLHFPSSNVLSLFCSILSSCLCF
jgi:hypothetical protein